MEDHLQLAKKEYPGIVGQQPVPLIQFIKLIWK